MQLAADPGAMPDLTQWRRAVAGVLAKARKVDAADLPAEPERLLDVQTYDGVTVAPLYTRIDERPEAALPGVFPYLRGRDATRDVHRGWHVNAEITAADAATANREILACLDAGTTAVTVAVGAGGVPVADLPAAVAGVLFDLAPVTLRAGADAAEAADALYAVLDGYRCAQPADIVVSLGASPLTSASPVGPMSRPTRSRRWRGARPAGPRRCGRSPWTAWSSTTRARATRRSWARPWRPGWRTCAR
jgi:methylmalonyl-CoA mutase